MVEEKVLRNQLEKSYLENAKEFWLAVTSDIDEWMWELSFNFYLTEKKL